MKKSSLLLTLLIVVFPLQIEAGLFSSVKKFVKNPKGYVAGKLFGGAVKGSMQPAIGELGKTLDNSIANFNSKMTDRISQFSDSIAVNLATFDKNLGERLVQVDNIAKDRILQFDTVLQQNIVRLNSLAIETVNEFNNGLAENILLLDRSLDENISKLDITGNSLRIRAIQNTYNWLLLAAILIVTILLGIQLYRKGYFKNVSNYKDMLTSKKLSQFWKVFLFPFIPSVIFLIGVHQVAILGPKNEQKKLVNEYLVPYNKYLKEINADELLRYGKMLKAVSTRNEHYELKAKILKNVFGKLNDPEFKTYLDIHDQIIDYYEFRDKKTEPDILAVEAYMLWQSKESKIEEYFSGCKAAESLLKQKNEESPFYNISYNYLSNYLKEPLSDDLVSKSITEIKNEENSEEYITYYTNIELREIFESKSEPTSLNTFYEKYLKFNNLTDETNKEVASAYYDFYSHFLNPEFKFHKFTINEIDSLRNEMADTIINTLETYYNEVIRLNEKDDIVIYYSSLSINDALYPKMKFIKRQKLTNNNIKESLSFEEIVRSVKNKKVNISLNELIPPRSLVEENSLKPFDEIIKNVLTTEQFKNFIFQDSLHNNLEENIYKYNTIISTFGSEDQQSQLLQSIFEIMESFASLKLYNRDSELLLISFYNNHLSKLELNEVEKNQIKNKFNELLERQANEIKFTSILI